MPQIQSSFYNNCQQLAGVARKFSPRFRRRFAAKKLVNSNKERASSLDNVKTEVKQQKVRVKAGRNATNTVFLLQQLSTTGRRRSQNFSPAFVDVSQQKTGKFEQKTNKKHVELPFLSMHAIFHSFSRFI